MGISMKQVIGLWGKNYSDVAKFLEFKSVSTIEKRVKNNSWKHHEVVMIVNEVEKETGIEIDLNLIKRNS